MRVAWLKDLRLADLPQVGGKNASLGEMTGALAEAGIRVPGGADNVLAPIRHVFASLYNDRAISYRVHQGFTHAEVALSAAVQQMVRSDLGSSGVLFTLDTESGFRDVVFITSSYGLGEMVVQGAVNPDEFYVHKPLLERGQPAIVRRALGSKLQKMVFGAAREAGKSTRTVDVPEAERNGFSLTDPEVLELARYAVAIERHYGRPMDIEWGKDGADGRIYVLQARPETVKSRKREVEERYALKGRSKVLVTGRAIGHKIGSGTVRSVPDASQMSRVKQGDVLVTDMTDPNWEPVMKLAAAIITNRGGRTCHAAIIARELGIPAVVGSGDATQKLKDGQQVTVTCAEGDTGSVLEGLLPFEVSTRECFELECAALRKVRETIGLTNVELMVPFVRTLGEAKQVLGLMEANGLKRGQNGLRIVMMCELPSNAVLAEQFLELFDGFSIGSNDLTQLTLGLDRDSGLVAETFDERDPAVKAMLAMAIRACRKQGKYVGICGQGPSDHPDLARWLMEQGIESLSLNPHTVVTTWMALAESAPAPKKSATA